MPATDSYRIPDDMRLVVEEQPVRRVPLRRPQSQACDLDRTVPFDHTASKAPGRPGPESGSVVEVRPSVEDPADGVSPNPNQGVPVNRPGLPIPGNPTAAMRIGVQTLYPNTGGRSNHPMNLIHQKSGRQNPQHPEPKPRPGAREHAPPTIMGPGQRPYRAERTEWGPAQVGPKAKWRFAPRRIE